MFARIYRSKKKEKSEKKQRVQETRNSEKRIIAEDHCSSSCQRSRNEEFNCAAIFTANISGPHERDFNSCDPHP